MTILEIRDERLTDVVDAGAEMETIADGFLFTEGVVWDRRADRFVFSDMAGDTMYQLRDGTVTPYRAPSRKANGNCWTPDGRLVTCEHATSRVVREELDGSLTVLADSFDGAELNSPNDVIAAADGTVLFTDPTFGRNEFFGVPRPLPRDDRGVYAVRASGAVLRLADDFAQPNGLCLSDDEQTLYVNDTERRHVRRFDFHGDSVSGGDVWVEVTGDGAGDPDGLKLDAAGNLWCTGPGGVHVFAPDGTSLGVVRVPKPVANFTWGGPDLRTLVCCATTTLYAVRTRQPGR